LGDKRNRLPGVNIEIINTGSELMLGYVLNTHHQWICQKLTERGYVVHRQVAITDSGPQILQAVRESMERADLIIVTGGLGPTSDDRTRDMIAQLLGRKLNEDPQITRHIESFFGRRNRPMPETTRVQALVPEGAMVLMNANGTAPGLVIDYDKGVLIMLPGPPRELRPMFLDQVLPYLQKRFGAPENFACTVFKTVGIGESFLEERIAAAIAPLEKEGLEVGYCARVGEVDLRLISRGPAAGKLAEKAEETVQDLLRGFIYGREPEQLEAVVVRILTEKNKTLALAESCTGGYIANRITNVPGASAVFLADVVTYSNSAKEKFLRVKSETLAAHGAVSEPVAREMAEGIRREVGADFGISVTGIAGPTGGTSEKPVGTVFIGFATPEGTEVKKFLNQYDRETFKFLTSQQVFDLLRKSLLRLP
jgi:nicotinamide-nucleotide amidase